MKNNSSDRPLLSALVWDEKHLKALLHLHHHPARLIQAEPWQAWIEARGGLERVLGHLRSAALSPNQEQIFNMILAHPDVPASFYHRKLNISPSAYFTRLNSLTHALLLHLNGWKPELTKASSKSAIPTNLPSALTPLIGAGESLATIISILRQPGARLLTLMGPGGAGKTRMAIAAGRELLEDFTGGVFFVPLETINDPELLPSQIARALNIETVGKQSLLSALKTYLSERQVLLVLDNFEQLLQAAQFVTDLLEAADQLKILATSREALNVYGEHRFLVPELLRPAVGNQSPLEQLNQWPAVALFVQRVQAHHPDFALTESNRQAVIAVCNRLDGLPLAIELAAAQVKFLAPDHALPQLEHNLKSLHSNLLNRPIRQKTLWDAIDWSYQLLSDVEKALFRRLAVFGREWSAEAAQAVCETDDTPGRLEKLTDKSLARYAPLGVDGELRFQMLQAVREYALERLSANDETQRTQRLHANYYLGVVLQAEPFISTPDQGRWMRRIEQERENLQIALQWMLDAGETDMADTLLGAVWRFYSILNIWSETRLWMERALAQGSHPKTLGRVKSLWGAYWLAAYQLDHSKALLLAQEGLRLAQEMGDQRLIGLLLQCLADDYVNRKQYEQALQMFEESLQIFRALGDSEETAWVLAHISDLFSRRGDVTQSMRALQESLALFHALEHDWGIAHTLLNLAVLLEQQNDIEQANIAIRESVRIFKQLGNLLGMGWTINFQGQLAFRQSDFETARKLFQEAQGVFEQMGDQPAVNSNREWVERAENAAALM